MELGPLIRLAASWRVADGIILHLSEAGEASDEGGKMGMMGDDDGGE